MPPNNTTTPGPITVEGNETGGGVGSGGEVVATPTNASNGSVVWTDGGVPVQVEQGPRWLVELFYDPPAWAGLVLLVAAVLVLVLVAISLVRHQGVPAGAGRDVGQNLLIVVTVAVNTTLLVQFADLAYWLDVLIGGGGGWLLGVALFGKLVPDHLEDDKETATEQI